jgi:cellulose synthase operon protein C
MLIVSVAVVGAMLEAESWGNEADDQYAVARGHYQREDWKLAARAFEAFVTKYPDDKRAGECVFLRGETLLQLRQYDDARKQYQASLARDPKGPFAAGALFRSGETAYLAGHFEAAQPDLTRFLAEHPNDPLCAYGLSYLGDIAMAGGQPAAAEGFFRDALKRSPQGRLEDDCRLGLARALEKLDKPDEAQKLYEAIASKPGSPLADTAQLQLGNLQYAAGKYDQAMATFLVFEHRLAKSPWQPKARLGCGLALLRLDRPEEAIRLFNAVLATQAPDDVVQESLVGRIKASLRLKDSAALERDAAEFERRFAASPLRADVQRLVARSLIERKQFARAVALLEPLVGAAQAGRATPQDIENRYLLAVGYEGLGRYAEALAALASAPAEAKEPLKTDALALRGSLLFALKRYAEAVAPLEALLAAKPGGEVVAQATARLAICLARSAQIERAKQVYTDLKAKHPGHAVIAPTAERLAEAALDANDPVWAAELSLQLAKTANSREYELKGKFNLGWSQFKAGRPAEAAATFDELLKGNPPEAMAAEAALVRGHALESLDQTGPAMAMYETVIERHPKSLQHADALLAAARLQTKQKHNAQAAALYQRLAQEHPQFPKLDAALYQWAWTMQELGKLDEAAAIFERLHKEHPQSHFWADATCRLAQRALDAKDFPAAAKLVDEALATKSDAGARPLAMLLRGQLAAAQGDWPATRAAFEAVLRDYPDHPRRPVAEYWIAESYYREHNFAAAAAAWDRMTPRIREKPESWMAMVPLRRAQILVQQNRWAEAQVIAAAIEKDYPRFEQQYEADYLLGLCFADQADFQSARRAFGKVIRSDAGAKTETAAMAQWRIGETYFHQKNYEAALEEYLKVKILYAYPAWQAAALLQAGKCRQRLGETQDAAKLYREVVTDYANTTFAKEAAELLAKLEKKRN